MTIQNAIENLKLFPDWNVDDGWLTENEMNELCDMAMSALEKQSSKKPRENEIRGGLFEKIKHYTCPTCGNCLLTKMMNERQNTSYCWDCGQKLDWSDED